MKSTRRSGFVAIIGKPNVGKSTLLNRIIGEKLSGVSPKPQTTRGVIRGIYTVPAGQIIFVDTPGHHVPQDSLGKFMLHEIEKAVDSVDVLYWMCLPRMPDEQERKILEVVQHSKKPVILVINQVDRYPKPEVLPVIQKFSEMAPFQEIIPISAKTGLQVPLLLEKTFELLPEGESLYPEDQISDQQERVFIQEIIREKIFLNTREEVPYATAVRIESFKERGPNLVAIEATILVDKESRKGILIGKKGEMLKKIGQASRVEIEKFLQSKVHLQLWIKVLSDWKNKEDSLRELGYS